MFLVECNKVLSILSSFDSNSKITSFHDRFLPLSILSSFDSNNESISQTSSTGNLSILSSFDSNPSALLLKPAPIPFQSYQVLILTMGCCIKHYLHPHFQSYQVLILTLTLNYANELRLPLSILSSFDSNPFPLPRNYLIFN